WGLLLSGILILVYFLLNFWTVRLFATANSAITVFKLVVPLLTVLGLVATGFHGENFTNHGGFAPYGWSGVLTAVATSGVVFAFNGFQSPRSEERRVGKEGRLRRTGWCRKINTRDATSGEHM